jgi:hypothetical protein
MTSGLMELDSECGSGPHGHDDAITRINARDF